MEGVTRIWLSLLLFAALAMTACGTTASTVQEKLDPVTGVTVTRSAMPLLFYRDNSSVAAYAREYVNAGPVMVNRMGDYNYFLWLGIWSTHGNLNDFSMVLHVDGEPIVLQHVGWNTDSINVSEPVYQKPVATTADAFYRISRDQLRLMSEARDIRISVANAYGSYEPWDNQQPAQDSLRAFLDYSPW